MIEVAGSASAGALQTNDYEQARLARIIELVHAPV
jgi:hypothetical protein